MARFRREVRDAAARTIFCARASLFCKVDVLMDVRASARSFVPRPPRGRCFPFACLMLLFSAYILPRARCQTVLVDTTRPVNSFRPSEALGAGVDRIPRVATDKIFTEPILKQILSAGWQTVTYRQNTEL